MGIGDRVRKLEGGSPPPACKDQPCLGPVGRTVWEPLLDEDGKPIYAEACPYPRGEFDDGVVAVRQLRLVYGTVPPPLCRECPYRRRAINHLRIVRNAYGKKVV